MYTSSSLGVQAVCLNSKSFCQDLQISSQSSPIINPGKTVYWLLLVISIARCQTSCALRTVQQIGAKKKKREIERESRYTCSRKLCFFLIRQIPSCPKVATALLVLKNQAVPSQLLKNTTSCLKVLWFQPYGRQTERSVLKAANSKRPPKSISLHITKPQIIQIRANMLHLFSSPVLQVFAKV